MLRPEQPPVTFCEEVQPKKNETRFPGDVCTFSDQCYKNGHCLDGVCQAQNGNVGATCRSTGECDVQMFCENSMCEPEKAVGSQCRNSDECGWGVSCFTDPKNFEKRCVTLLSLPDGTEVGMSDRNAYYCQSSNVFKRESDSMRICSPGDVSITTYSSGLPLGEKCFYKHFNDTSNWNNYVVMSSEAQCGFNQDDKAYCPQRKGDSVYSDYIRQLTDAYAANLNCNYLSDEHYHGALDFDCAEFIAKFGKDSSFNLLHVQANFLIEENGSHIVANNPSCVKDAITAPFWFPFKDPAFAAPMSIVGALVATLALLG